MPCRSATYARKNILLPRHDFGAKLFDIDSSVHPVKAPVDGGAIRLS